MTNYSTIAEQQRDEIAAAQVARNEARARGMHQDAGTSATWEGRKTNRAYWRRRAQKEIAQ